jgi:DNA polymerase V
MHQSIQFPAIAKQPAHIPLYSDKVAAGFPSPADDYVEAHISLDELLIYHRDATFFVRARGSSMEGAGIFEGDLLIVDKSLSAVSGDIVIAFVDGGLTMKRFIDRDGKIILKPENPHFKDIEFKEGQELQIWGVVISSVQTFRKG